MAVLPSEMYLIQQIGDFVYLFEKHTERQIVKFSVNDRDAIAKAQGTIYESELSDEDKTFAHFWSGYFYGIASWVEKDGYSMKEPSIVQEKDWNSQYDGTSFGA